MLSKIPKETVILLIFLILSFFFADTILAIVPILLAMILFWIYSLFYTERPKSYWFFFAIGLASSINNWNGMNLTWIYIGCSIILLECLRVYLMAIFMYPRTIHQLKTLNEDLEERVRQRTLELEDSHAQLQKANEELLELDKMKSAFVSQASHDLRTPLTAIKGSLDNLLFGIAGELTDKQKKVLVRAQRSVDRLALLVNDILDLNRIESGRMTIEKQEFQLYPVIEGCINENRPAADLKHIQLQFESFEGDSKIFADPGKIERIVGELIGNAIKYTPDEGRVTVSFSQNGAAYRIDVQDTGYGMSVEECGKIWERFYRSPNVSKSALGSGLGLSIAKELIEMHEGTIQVESTTGQGTRFTIQLPNHTSIGEQP